MPSAEYWQGRGNSEATRYKKGGLGLKYLCRLINKINKISFMKGNMTTLYMSCLSYFKIYSTQVRNLGNQSFPYPKAHSKTRQRLYSGDLFLQGFCDASYL